MAVIYFIYDKNELTVSYKINYELTVRVISDIKIKEGGKVGAAAYQLGNTSSRIITEVKQR